MIKVLRINKIKDQNLTQKKDKGPKCYKKLR
jgi:hypothetical protein